MFGGVFSGVLLGLSAGVAPGPLLAFVISQTLRFGPGEGARAALSPLLSDLPIVFLALLLHDRMTVYKTALPLISILGALYVAYLALETWRASAADLEALAGKGGALWKGGLINLLNPHPYLFWLTVGAPLTLGYYADGVPSAVGFVGSFYLFLVGSKVVLALLMGRWRNSIGSGVYRRSLQCLALMLVFFAFWLAKGCLESVW